MSRKKARNGHRRHAAHVGTPPGTLHVQPDRKPPNMQVFAFDENEYTEGAIREFDDIHAYLERWAVTWVNVDGLGEASLLQRFGELFDLHRLALEDVLSHHQRPKVEQYESNLFMVIRMLDEGPPLSTEQLSIFVGDRFVLTFQEHPGDCLDEVRDRIRTGRGKIRTMGSDYLAYCLLDAVVDAYYPHLDEFSERMEALENEVLERPSPAGVVKIHALRRDLLTVRRALSPLREAVNMLLRDGMRSFSEQTLVYLRDCYDHTVQVLEMVEMYREITAGLLDVYLSSVSNRMNEIMKVLTIIATVFIPLSFLAGIYGMNFNTQASPWNMPELGWYWGYPAFIVLAVAVAAFELMLFWRKGWLTPATRVPRPAEKEDD